MPDAPWTRVICRSPSKRPDRALGKSFWHVGGIVARTLAWVDLSSSDAQASRDPTAWSVYIGTDDIEALAQRVQAAGGTVIAPPFDVGDQGTMAVLQDPSGAFISAWQGSRMGGFQTDAPNSFGWSELNARGIEQAIPFYPSLFGWTTRTSEMGEGQPPYTEFLLDGESVAGAWEMDPMVPARCPATGRCTSRSKTSMTRSGRRSKRVPSRSCRRRTSRADASRS